MPELPEVETIRSQLEPILIGQTIESISVLREKSWSGKVDGLVGAKIITLRRKAKVLFIELREAENQETCFLMIHLKMTGQLIYETSNKLQDTRNKQILNPKNQLTIHSNRIVGGHPNNSWTNQLPDKHTRVILTLSKGTVFFNDQRVFGWVKAVNSLEVNTLIRQMPPDIIDEECDSVYFYKVLQSSRRPVKVLIMDSHKIGGVGNIYACDGLFDAGIDPKRAANSLTRKESDRLLKSLKKIVNKSIKLGGATAADGKFVNTQGLGGRYQDEFLVYEQEGVIVERDGKKGIVTKFKLDGRGTYWVPNLQK